jgi:hypothetical protein
MIVINLAEIKEIHRELSETMPKNYAVYAKDIGEAFYKIEEQMDTIGILLAQYFRVHFGDAEIQSPDFGGAAITFSARSERQKCPELLQRYDPDGEL